MLVFSAIVPATWVPWPFSSSGRRSPSTKSWPLTNCPAAKSGLRRKRAAHRAVGDPGVEHGDGHARGAGMTRCLQVFPGADRVDAAGGDRQQRRRQALPGQEVPLLRDPAAGRARRSAERPGIVGDRRFFFARRGGGDVVGGGVGDVGVGSQRGRRLVDAGPPGQGDGSRSPGPRQLDDQPGAGRSRGRPRRRPQLGPAPARASGPRAGLRRRSGSVDSSLVWPLNPCNRAGPSLTPARRRSCSPTYSPMYAGRRCKAACRADDGAGDRAGARGREPRRRADRRRHRPRRASCSPPPATSASCAPTRPPTPRSSRSAPPPRPSAAGACPARPST